MKQVIVVRSDLKLSKGKLAVQSAHASYSSAKKSKETAKWEKEGQKKIVLKVKDLDQLLELNKKCIDLKLPHALISDAGLTEIKKGTVTCLGIGPADDAKINKVIGSLPLLS